MVVVVRHKSFRPAVWRRAPCGHSRASVQPRTGPHLDDVNRLNDARRGDACSASVDERLQRLPHPALLLLGRHPVWTTLAHTDTRQSAASEGAERDSVAPQNCALGCTIAPGGASRMMQCVSGAAADSERYMASPSCVDPVRAPCLWSPECAFVHCARDAPALSL